MIRRFFWVFFIVFVVNGITLVSCKSNDSEVEIINGVPTSDYRRVVFMFLADKTACTATIISHNTILTAAHCLVGLKESNDRSIYVQLGPERFAITEKYMYSSKYEPNNRSTNMHDVGVVVFDDNTFEGFSPLKIVNYHPQPADKVILVGFGCFTKTQLQPDGNRVVVCDAEAGYSKRVGKNHIYDKVQGDRCTPGMIQVNQQYAHVDSDSSRPTGEDAIMWLLDSGGPLLLEPSNPDIDYYRLIGVASYANPLYVNERLSCYSDPSYPDNIAFFKEAVSTLGARIDFE